MPRAKKASPRNPKTTVALAKELSAVKAAVEELRDRYARMSQTLLRLCCPKEWFEEEVDDDELWSKAVWEPSLRHVIDSLR